MKAELRKLPAILVGLVIICSSLKFFLLPHGIASAGVGAIGYLLETAFDWNQNLVVWIINLSMLACAGLLLEKSVVLRVILGSLLFPVCLGLFPQVMVLPSFSLSLIIGSLLFSVGVHCLYLVQASNGGVTIPPLIFQKYFQWAPASGLMLTNLVIILLNYVAFGWFEALVSTCSILLISFFMKKMSALPLKRTSSTPELAECLEQNALTN